MEKIKLGITLVEKLKLLEVMIKRKISLTDHTLVFTKMAIFSQKEIIKMANKMAIGKYTMKMAF